MKKIFYTVAEAREALGIGTTAIYTLLASGKLRARKLNSATLIEAESINEFAQSLPRGNFTTHQRQTEAREAARNTLRDDGVQGEAL